MKGFDKDISPATISSWIKQTVILCYELSDQEGSGNRPWTYRSRDLVSLDSRPEFCYEVPSNLPQTKLYLFSNCPLDSMY